MALIANTAWLDEDLTMFQSMVVGLIDEQVQVTQVVPDRLSGMATSGFCAQVLWRDSRWKLVRRFRLGRLSDRLRQPAVDVIHALDGRVWDGSLRLAKRLGVPVVLGACSAIDVAQVDRVRRLTGSVRASLVATTKPLAAAIQKKQVSGVPVEVVPLGIHLLPPSGPPNTDPRELCAVVTGNGIYDGQYEALLVAIESVVEKRPQSQFFLDGQGGDQRLLWQAAKRHGLLANVNLVPKGLGHRELLLRADVLIQPQSLGRSRTLTLQAMSRGVPVMALTDPWLDYLIDQETAWVVDKAKPALWVSLIDRFAESPQLAVALAGRARQWVGQHHLAATQVARMLGLYRQVTGESIKFPGS